MKVVIRKTYDTYHAIEFDFELDLDAATFAKVAARYAEEGVDVILRKEEDDERKNL